MFGIAENLSLGVTGRVGDEVGQFFAAVRGGDVRHDRGGEDLTGSTTFERGGSEPEDGWLKDSRTVKDQRGTTS